MIKITQKYVLIFCLIFALMFACEDESDEREIIENAEATVELLFSAFENFDLKLHEKIWLNDPSLKVHGIYAGNNISGWESLKQHLVRTSGKIENSKFEILDQHLKVNSSLNTAWFSILANQNYVIGGKPRTISGIRFTGVLKRMDNEWRIVQFHGSVPLTVDLD